VAFLFWLKAKATFNWSSQRKLLIQYDFALI